MKVIYATDVDHNRGRGLFRMRPLKKLTELVLESVGENVTNVKEGEIVMPVSLENERTAGVGEAWKVVDVEARSIIAICGLGAVGLAQNRPLNAQNVADALNLSSAINLILEQIRAKQAKLGTEVDATEEKLNKLRDGVTLVRPEDRKAVRKRMFRDIWDTITENSPKDLKEFKEELGIEYDKDVGVSLQSLSELMPQNKKRGRGQ
ncbi:hypothetical protein MKW98_015682 [Papaver atlanticum]|uniref:Leucine zipper with capping helix domain-containing protein n=1 Tax=Papaver atlanticum TaxID=357466 RepID=A0AAD4XGS0_9MAGN|nr:hypothetical protein MKW98_015682 [Papaver atlanticum]